MQCFCMRSALLVITLLAGLASFVACSESTLEPLPLQITIESNRPTAAPEPESQAYLLVSAEFM